MARSRTLCMLCYLCSLQHTTLTVVVSLFSKLSLTSTKWSQWTSAANKKSTLKQKTGGKPIIYRPIWCITFYIISTEKKDGFFSQNHCLHLLCVSKWKLIFIFSEPCFIVIWDSLSYYLIIKKVRSDGWYSSGSHNCSFTTAHSEELFRLNVEETAYSSIVSYWGNKPSRQHSPLFSPSAGSLKSICLSEYIGLSLSCSYRLWHYITHAEVF